MGTILLLGVDAATAASLRGLGEHAFVDDDADPCTLVRHLESGAGSVDVVVLGVATAEPVRLAQRAQIIDRDLSVLILTEPDQHARIVAVVQHAPFLSTVVRSVPAQAGMFLADAIDQAAAQTVRRRGFRSVEARAREQLGTATRPPVADAIFLQHVLEHAPISILALDHGGRIQASNRAAQTLLGASERDLLGRELAAGLPAGERLELDAALVAHLDPHTTHPPFSLTLSTPRGARLVEASVSALPTPEGRPLVIVMLKDVTEQRDMMVQLRAADRLASVGLLAAGVAHEVNNPLTAVLVNVDRAVKALESPDVADQPLAQLLRAPLRDALEASDRIQGIVRDLMLFARGDDESLGPVEVEPVLKSTVRMAANQIRHRATLIESYARVPFVRSNAARLGQVFLNLVLNSIQAMREELVAHNQLSISTRANDTHVQVEIADNGPGIAPDVMERLFTPFFTTKPPGEGTGLGLSICHRIVTSMGGSIQLESELGKGTLARITLPRAVAAVAACAATPPAPVAAIVEATVTTRRRVLLVDDDPVVLRTTGKVLAMHHDVEAVGDPLEALTLAAVGAFDVIVCDLMMPKMTGMELHAALLTRAPAAAHRMVFMTGGAFTAETRAFLDAHPGRVLNKPFRTAELLALVASVER